MAPLEWHSLFSFRRVAAAAFAAPERRFFWMQDHWAGLRRILIEEFCERGPMRQTSRHDVAGKRFSFHEPSERLRPFCADRFTDRFNELRVQFENVERASINVQFLNLQYSNLRSRLETER